MQIANPPFVLSSGMVVPAALDDPRIAQVIDFLVRVWPEMAVRLDKEVVGWYPVVIHPGGEVPIRGHYSGASENPEWLYSSIDDPFGGAEGLLHEYGHLSLKRRGLFYEHWSGVLANDPGELYVSPIRKDKKRPMGAVVHAQYSYLFVTEFEKRGLALGLGDLPTFTLNQARLAEGVQVIETGAKPAPDGIDLIAEIIRWSHALVRYRHEDHVAESPR